MELVGGDADGQPVNKPMSQSPERFGHPPGLRTLFFTEMWERMSYYGMRGLLVLFMVQQVAGGGMGLTDEIATAIYGLYTAGVYLAAVPGGWIGDRMLGAQRAVWIGGILIACGHFSLALPMTQSFFFGLILIVIGSGLLKPNISGLVGSLYPQGGHQRDAGFTIFYMGVNLGATLGPLVCSYLGEKFNWHYGFTASGAGMVLGLLYFKMTRHHLGDAGLAPAPAGSGAADRRNRLIVWSSAGAILAATLAAMAGWIVIDPVWIARWASLAMAALAAVSFTWLLFFMKLDRAARRKMIVILILVACSALFWAGFEQAGSSMNLFADRYTDRHVPGMDFEIPAGWFLSFNSVAVIVFAPVFAWLWLKLARSGIEVSLIAKFGWAMVLLAAGFLIFSLGAGKAIAGGPVWPGWLASVYLFHTFGELCLSPVGLSSITKLSPPGMSGQMLGLWFLATSLGNLAAGLFAGEITGDNSGAMPGHLMGVAIVLAAAGALLFAIARPVRRLMPDVS